MDKPFIEDNKVSVFLEQDGICPIGCNIRVPHCRVVPASCNVTFGNLGRVLSSLGWILSCFACKCGCQHVHIAKVSC